MITNVDHVGIAVRNLEESLSHYEKCFGATGGEVEEVPDQKVRVAFLHLGGALIELLESTSPDGPIGRFIEKRGPGMHHIALAVTDVSAELERLGKSGVRLIDQTPRVGAHGRLVAFLHPSTAGGVLVELCEKLSP